MLDTEEFRGKSRPQLPQAVRRRCSAEIGKGVEDQAFQGRGRGIRLYRVHITARDLFAAAAHRGGAAGRGRGRRKRLSGPEALPRF